MLHQEKSEVLVEHHPEQLACGSLRGMDDGCSSFLPQKHHAAAEWNAMVCPVNTTVPSSLAAGVVKEVNVNNNKRHASTDMPDGVECKRMKEEDQIVSEKGNHMTDADVDVPGHKAYGTFERRVDSLAYESEESEDEGVDSPVHFSLGHTCVEDYLQSASFHQREDVFLPMGLCPVRKPIPIGPNYQAELPECISGKKGICVHDYDDLSSPSHMCDGAEDDSDKWLRDCIIPMPSSNELSLTLKPVYSKEDCDCVDEYSIECVKKHVREAREGLRGAFGPDTFKALGFYDMGEEVALRWTNEDEHLFQEVVSSNPASLGRNFWDELPLAFPSKTSKELVSYYFNVFMLRKRAEQNRFDPINVDSDNDEWQRSDGDEFAIMDRAGEDFPLESLTDQDDGACNQVYHVENIHEDSNEDDEFDCASEDSQQKCGVERDAMVSEGCPVGSFVDHTEKAFRFDTDVQDDSCTSFETQQVGVANETPADIAEDYFYRNDGFGGGVDHGYFSGHCDPKVWDIGLMSGLEKDEFLSTNNVIEEVFGKESCKNENGFCTGQDII